MNIKAKIKTPICLFLLILTTIYKRIKLISREEIKINVNILAGLLIVFLLLSSSVSAAEQLKVSTSRYSIYAPWMINLNYNLNLSGNFTAFALHLNNGMPVSGTNITFEIYANGTLKSTQYNITQENGLASVSYKASNMTGVFTMTNDSDYGNWTITAYLTATPAVSGSTNMSIQEGGKAVIGATVSCSNDYCHKRSAISTVSAGNYTPHSPYTDMYGQDTSFAEASHLKRNHYDNNARKGCYICHPGYASNKTGAYGYTNDVHKNRTCDFCHGNWTYLNLSRAKGGGGGLPIIPSCYDCHPQYNNNITQISTLANLTPGPHANATGVNISVYSYNFDTGAPLTAHNGTNSSLIASVPCVVCHGPAHNNSKPDPALTNSNNITESSQCISCHGQKHANGTSCIDCHTQDVHAIIKPDTTNCIGCHDTGGMATIDVDFDYINNSESIHRTLNFNNSNNITRNNSECWGCHGDGDSSQNAQPSAGHPLNYNTPKNCNNNICHSLSQSSYKEPMIYSHFTNASLNGNPNNNTNYNITTSEECQNCHINSIVTDDSNSELSRVSHYASKKNLIDSFNCVYCHLDEDNSEDWGDAILINEDREGTIEVNREDNNITLFQGQTVYLGEGYSLKLIEISKLRGDALIQIKNKNVIVDQVLVHKDIPYTYKRKITIDKATFSTPAVTININTIFTGTKDSFIQFDAYRPRKLHTEKESKDSACFACHLNRYSNEKERYKVIDRETNDDDDEIIYYTRVLLDQKLENKSKIYLNDENFVFEQLGIMDKFIPVPKYQKYLEDGQTWQISDRYSLRFKASSTDRMAWLEFMIDGVTVEDKVVTTGSVFSYEPDLNYNSNSDNMTIFTTNVTSVFLGKKDFIILEDSELLSTQILESYANTTLFGYNGSWLYPGDRFTIGKIPSNLHVPNLLAENRNWADCVGCHDTSNNLRITQINAISSQLGKHSILNAGADNITILSDTIDKACWGCHTEGTEPLAHPPAYNVPRNCTSCHKDREMPYYGARYIGDKEHGNRANCEGCHVSESHNIRIPGEASPVNEITSPKNQTNISKDTGISPASQKITPGLSVAYFLIMFLVAYLVIYGFGKKL